MTDWIPPEIIQQYGNSSGGVGLNPYGSSTTTGSSTNTTEAKYIEHGRLLMALSEGPGVELVNGLKSIYLDGTPVQNSDGSFNFKGVTFGMVTGTNTQYAIPGFPAAESEVSVNTKVENGAPITKTISTTGIDAVRVKIRIPSLKSINATTGEESGTQVDFVLQRQSPNWNGGNWGSVPMVEDGTGIYGRVKDKFGTPYTKGYRVELPAAGPWQVRLSRITADSSSNYLQNDLYWDSYTEITDAKLRYPNTAALAVVLNAEVFPSLPQIHAECYGVHCHVPTNYDPVARTYATTGPGTNGGTWDGTFKLAWTNNPAWLFYEAAINTRWGAGISATAIDKWELYTISQMCDEDVDDGHGGTEPRFTCSIHIQGQENAITVLNNLASAFRGMLYSAGGKIVPVQDVDDTPVALFNKANVSRDSGFSYQGVSRQSRHNAALVTWNDPVAGYSQAIEAVEDSVSIARYGYNPIELQGFGLRTQGAAYRLGLYTLLSEKMQPEMVTFEPALDSMSVRPGNIVQVDDPEKGGIGGRVLSATTTQITLDRPVTLASGQTYTIKCRLSTGAVEARTVSTAAGTVSVLTVSTGFSAAPPVMGIWGLHEASSARMYRVVSIKDNGPLKREITALYHDPAKYALLDSPVLTAFTSGTPIVSAAPTDLVVSAGTTTRQNVVSPFVSATWTVCANAIGYRADASLNYGPWLPMRLTGHYAEIVNAEPGDYRVRVIAVYPRGRTSVPVESTVNVPDTDLPPAIQSLADSISDFSSDSKFSPVEKSAVRKEWNTLPGDKSILDAQATAFNITTEKATYDAAFQALATYLNNGTTWTSGVPTWIADANLGTTTDIVPATFRTKFEDYSSARTALVAAISAVAKAIADGAVTSIGTINSPDVLSRAKKPDMLIRYNGELQIKTDLDAKATTLGVSHTAYDNAVAAVTTFLQGLGGSSPNWAYLDMTTDTSMGTGGGATLRGLWDTVASTRSALQSAISGAYPAYQIAAGATDAMQKATFTTANKIRGDLMVDQSIFAKSVVAANHDNLIPNPNSEMDLANAPSGAFEGVGVSADDAYEGLHCRAFAGNGVDRITNMIPVQPTEKYYIRAYIRNRYTTTGVGSYLYLRFWDTPTHQLSTDNTTPIKANTWTLSERVITIPANAVFMTVDCAREGIMDAANNYGRFDSFYLRRMSDASVLVDGTLTTLFCRVGNDIQSTNYVAGSTGNAPVGLRISAFAFTSTHIDGSTNATCQMELGGSGNFGGYKVATVVDKVFNNAVSANNTQYINVSTGTTAGIMCGQGIYITPKSSTVAVIISGIAYNGNAGGYGYVRIKYGTGTKPASGSSASVGTGVGDDKEIYSVVANHRIGFSRLGVITGLTIGTQYWIDLAIASGQVGNTITISNGVDILVFGA